MNKQNVAQDPASRSPSWAIAQCERAGVEPKARRASTSVSSEGHAGARENVPKRVIASRVVHVLALFTPLLMVTTAHAEKPLKVVATLSVFADLVKQVGGEHVEVSFIASPKFNPHFIEPKPSDVLKVKKADLLVHGGLDLEVWRGPLIDAAGNPKVFPGQSGELDISHGVHLLEIPTATLDRSMGDIHLYGNPHFWLSPENGKVMVQAIAAKLLELDPIHTSDYQSRLTEFLSRLDSRTALWKQQAAAIHGKEVVAYHNEWPYLAEFLGIKIDRFLEPKPGIPPGPQHLGALQEYMKAQSVRAIVQPTYISRGTSDALAKRTGAKVVILCQNLGELPQTQDYISFIDYDVQQLVQALKGDV